MCLTNGWSYVAPDLAWVWLGHRAQATQARLAIKLADGFDRAFFDPDGQRDFTDGLNSPEEPESQG